MSNEPSLDEIIAARNECALIVTTHGEQFLPIFERLEKEINLHRKQKNLLQKALQIGAQNETQIGTHLKFVFLLSSK